MRHISKAHIACLAAIVVGVGVYVGYLWLNNDSSHPVDASSLRFDQDRVVQVDYDDDSSVVFGVVSDIHGQAGRARRIGQILKKKQVSFILVPGDVANNEALRSGVHDLVPDHQEIQSSLEALAQTNLPIFVIPGNHERTDDWNAALAEVMSSYPNVIDMARYRVFDGDDVDIVSLPGYQIREDSEHRFIPEDGYFASPQIIQETERLTEGLDDPIVLLTHGAGRTASPGPATIYSGDDVGDEITTRMMRNAGIHFAVVGHIHEAAGLATRLDGTPTPEGEWSNEFVLNAGTLLDWRMLDGAMRQGTAALVAVDGGRARFEMVYLE